VAEVLEATLFLPEVPFESLRELPAYPIFLFFKTLNNFIV
jgi:hypothetical protein